MSGVCESTARVRSSIFTTTSAPGSSAAFAAASERGSDAEFASARLAKAYRDRLRAVQPRPQIPNP